MRIIKLMADYGCHPLWDIGPTGPRDIDPQNLPLSESLIKKLEIWSRQYDETLNEDYPPDSGFPTTSEHGSFVMQGKYLAQEISKELGSEYKVFYYDDLIDKTIAIEN